MDSCRCRRAGLSLGLPAHTATPKLSAMRDWVAAVQSPAVREEERLPCPARFRGALRSHGRLQTHQINGMASGGAQAGPPAGQPG